MLGIKYEWNRPYWAGDGLDCLMFILWLIYTSTCQFLFTSVVIRTPLQCCMYVIPNARKISRGRYGKGRTKPNVGEVGLWGGGGGGGRERWCWGAEVDERTGEQNLWMEYYSAQKQVTTTQYYTPWAIPPCILSRKNCGAVFFIKETQVA